jgi:predicted nucleic acid-binding protein
MRCYVDTNFLFAYSRRAAFHAAHALDSGCPVIVSSDPDYDRLATLRRVGPS